MSYWLTSILHWHNRINAVIDKAHKTLSDALNRVSDGLKKFVKNIADTTLKVINAALDLYESARQDSDGSNGKGCRNW